MIVTTRHTRSLTAVSSSARSRASSLARPTNGESIRRSIPAAPGSTSSKRHASTGSDLPFSTSGEHRLGPNGIAHQPERRVADQDLVAAGRRLQALCDHDGVARRECLPVGRVAGDYLAGVDAGTHPDPDPMGRLELVVQLRELVAQLDRRAHRPQRVVLVHERDAERRHDRVADELLDRAAVPLQDLAGRLVVAGPDVAQRLGIELLAERSRIGHVAKDERDGLPDHEASLGRFQSDA